VLVDVRAASVNPVDGAIRAGGPIEPGDGLPHVGGSDAAGVVEAVGPGVESFAPGDRVFATGLGVTGPGTYAESTVVPADRLAALPGAVSFREGAAAAMAFATSWRALIGRGDLSIGDAALIHGGSGGVGHAAVQVAAAAGADVIATARDGEPAALARDLGADAVVDYRDDDLAGAVRAAAGGGVDVVLEPHADANIGADLGVLARGGRITVIGDDPPIRIPAGPSRAAKAADADLRFMSIIASPDDQADVLRAVAPRLADGTFRVEIADVYPLAEAAAAQERLGDGGVLGKLVLDTAG